MADKLGLGPETRQLKLGQTFSNPRSNAFHTIRYDFKPASVDINKMSTVEVGNSNQVTVKVPHLDGAGVPQTLFKGSQRPYQKECVLIIDRVTGEITLEKLSSNIQVKKTRAESSYKTPSNRPVTPVDQPTIGQRTSSKTKVTSGSRRNAATSGLIPKHSPLHASPSHNPSPNKVQERQDPLPTSLGSLPIIGLDDVCEPPTSAPVINPTSHMEEEHNGEVGTISSSSSSSSSSSDSDSDSEPEHNGKIHSEPHVTNGNAPGLSVPHHLLNDDLCLSESATDSD